MSDQDIPNPVTNNHCILFMVLRATSNHVHIFRHLKEVSGLGYNQQMAKITPQ
jgi:hypothetical protein